MIGLGIAAVGLVAWVVSQRRLERALGAMSARESEQIAARTRTPERFAVAVVVVGLAVFVAMGRGPTAIGWSVPLFAINAIGLAVLRCRATPDPIYRSGAILHAIGSVAVFGGVALWLVQR